MTKIRRTKKAAPRADGPSPTPEVRPGQPEPVKAAQAQPRTADACPAAAQHRKRPANAAEDASIRIYSHAGQARKKSAGQPVPGAEPARRGQRGKPDSSRDDAPHTPSTLRLFFALKVPVNIANPLAERQRQLRGNWRAVRPDQMHVTLAYLPGVPPERVADLKRLGTRLTEHLAPLHVKLRGTGYFPNEGSPRVWFVKVEADGLTELAAELRAGIQALGLETEEQAFKAHITLARKKGPAPRVPPITFDAGWQAGSAALYRSILRKTGPIYELESTFRFRGDPTPAATTPETGKTLTDAPKSAVTQETT